MIVIPAVDIKAGRCVRLRQGRMEDETIYSDAPEDMAQRWVSQGAERLHLVDLDGAAQGRPVNQEAVRRAASAVSVPVQLGGGIRSLETIETYLAAGVSQVILGTSAIKDPGFAEAACREFPGRIILGLDARGGKVAVEGWTEETGLSPASVGRRYQDLGISAIIFTDIERDGMESGPNVEGARVLARSLEIPVIVSGGISGIEDVAKVARLAQDGVAGMITGRALYQGSLDLAAAIRETKKWDSGVLDKDFSAS
jgi:phosphoribosylformimino-5-aminoimidazole carboxamide ribotide isomerase